MLYHHNHRISAMSLPALKVAIQQIKTQKVIIILDVTQNTCRHFKIIATLHSTGPPLLLLLLLLLALIPALLMCNQGSLAQFLNSCSMAMWRTCSSDARESFSCTAAVSSSNTSVEGERARNQDSIVAFTNKR